MRNCTYHNNATPSITASAATLKMSRFVTLIFYGAARMAPRKNAFRIIHLQLKNNLHLL